MKLRSVASLLVLGSVLSCPVAAEDAVQLRVQLEPGQEIRQRVTTQMQNRQAVPGQAEPMTMEMTSIFDTTQEVLDGQAADGELLLATTIARVRMNMDTGMPGVEPIRLDTDDPGADAAGPAAAQLQPLRDLVGKPMRVTMTPRGEVRSIDPGEFPLPAETREMVDSMLTGTQPLYPEEPVSIGEGWTQEVEGAMPGGPPMKIAMEWTLTGFDEEVARFDVAGDNGLELEPQGAGVMKMSMQNRGTASVDRGTGLVRDMAMDQTISGEMDVQGMKIPLDMTMQTTVETVE